MVPLGIKNSNYFAVCSTPLKQYLMSKGINTDQIEIIRNGVDINLFKPHQKYSQNEKFIVTYAGSFRKYQGVNLLVRAAKLLQNKNVFFKLIGFNENDLELKKKIKQTLEKVILIDRLPRSELVNHLQTSDILIIPREIYRNLPNELRATTHTTTTKFAECIAVGKPVIVTNLDDSSEFVNKYDCGFVCEPTAKSIAETILKTKEMPSTILHRKGKNSRKLAEAVFDQRIINRLYYAFLSRIVM